MPRWLKRPFLPRCRVCSEKVEDGLLILRGWHEYRDWYHLACWEAQKAATWREVEKITDPVPSGFRGVVG